jgi:uncharacterized protein YbjT (DUF2867 family)
MILITGASGMAGGAVLREMLKTRKDVKAMYRSREEAAKAPVGVLAVIADFSDLASLRTALEEVDTVFLVCAPIRELVELESNVIDVCREAGVRRVVLHSALGAEDHPKSFPSWHRRTRRRAFGRRARFIWR